MHKDRTSHGEGAKTIVVAGVRNGPCLDWSVRSSGFPLRDSHGNPGDRYLATVDEFIGQERAACQC